MFNKSEGYGDLDRMRAIKINPIVGLAAITKDQGGAFRAWTVARNLSNDGNVSRQRVLEIIEGFGRHPRTAKRWVRQAVEAGMLKDGGERLFYTAWGKVSGKMGGKWIAKPVFSYEPERLFNPGWRGFIWECFLRGFEGSVISRETLEKISGIDWRTQINYETNAVEKRANFAKVGKLKKGQDWVNYVKTQRQEFDEPFLFNGQGDLIRQLPNLYLIDNARLRTFKANKRYPNADLMQTSQEKILRGNGRKLANKRYFDNPKKSKAKANAIRAYRKYGGERYYMAWVGEDRNGWVKVTDGQPEGVGA